MNTSQKEYFNLFAADDYDRSRRTVHIDPAVVFADDEIKPDA
jgi:hypothetical protein